MEQLESETGCKASLLGHCNVIGCTNGRRQICDWEAENCEVHEGRLNELTVNAKYCCYVSLPFLRQPNKANIYELNFKHICTLNFNMNVY